MNALDFNRAQMRRGLFTDKQIAKLVVVLQERLGFDPKDVDGKFGTVTEAGLDALGIELPGDLVTPNAVWDEGSKWWPTPNPDVWAGWVYPMPILAGGIEPGVSSGFAQYGKGPNAKDRPNHWGNDIMYHRHNGDGGPAGKKAPPIYSKNWYCPDRAEVWACGPGTVFAVSRGGAGGDHVLIDHHTVPGFGKLATWYQHLHEVFVEEGDVIDAAEVLGTLEPHSYVHLHFEFRNCNLGKGRAQTVVNPKPYLDLFEKRVA